MNHVLEIGGDRKNRSNDIMEYGNELVLNLSIYKKTACINIYF